MVPFLKKGAKIKLIPDPDWDWFTWDGNLTITGTQNLLDLTGHNCLLNIHVPNFGSDYIPQQYTSKVFKDIPGVLENLVCMVDEPTLSKIVSVNSALPLLNTTTGKFTITFSTPSQKIVAFGTDPDVEALKTGTWKVVDTNQQVFHEHKVDLKATEKNDHSLNTSDAQKTIESTEKLPTLREARARAFLRMIRVGEGTEGEQGYQTLYGGQSFIKDYGKDWSTHPQIKVTKGNYTSSAAGAYQILGFNYKELAPLIKKYNIPDFSPESQDKIALIILKYKRKALDSIMNGDFDSAINKTNNEWASLPGSKYGQNTVSMSTAEAKYDTFLQQEQNGDSDLHVQNSFIDTLGK